VVKKTLRVFRPVRAALGPELHADDEQMLAHLEKIAKLSPCSEGCALWGAFDIDKIAYGLLHLCGQQHSSLAFLTWNAATDERLARWLHDQHAALRNWEAE